MSDHDEKTLKERAKGLADTISASAYYHAGKEYIPANEVMAPMVELSKIVAELAKQEDTDE